VPWEKAALEGEDANGWHGSGFCAAVGVKGDGICLNVSGGSIRRVGNIVVDGEDPGVVGEKGVNNNGAQVHDRDVLSGHCESLCVKRR